MPNRVTRGNLALHPYKIESPNGCRRGPGPHIVHDPNVRLTQTLVPVAANNQYRVTLAADPNGDTIYLPYQPEQIHSLVLPAAPLGGVKNFLTANLTGCWIYIEVKTNGNIVVYHANRSAGVSPTEEQSATNPVFQTPECIEGLDDLLQGTGPDARSQWATLRKADYMQSVLARLNYKAAQGRTGIEYVRPQQMCEATVAGFFRDGKWEFWFQTYGRIYYRRPRLHWQSFRGRRTVEPTINDYFEIFDVQRFFRAP